MRITMTVLLLVVGALAFTAGPATAGAEDKARIAELEAEVARGKAEKAKLVAESKRLQAEMTHLREAYNQLSANATRATRSLEVLTNSLTAAREMQSAWVQEREQRRGEVTQQRAEAAKLRAEVARLRSEIVARPADDPAHLKLALHDAQIAHTGAITKLHTRLAEMNDLANNRAVRATGAESALAVAKEKHAQETAALQAKLAQAEATIKQLRAAR